MLLLSPVSARLDVFHSFLSALFAVKFPLKPPPHLPITTLRQTRVGHLILRDIRAYGNLGMNIDLISEGAWTSVVLGTRTVHFEFLGLQLFLVNLRARFQAKEISIHDCIRELKTFYAKFSRLPMAERDFARIADSTKRPTNLLLDPGETARRILAGQSLILAGEEHLLATLPPGNWIGGTIPYFMANDGGRLCKDKIFVTEIPAEFHASTQRYTAAEMPALHQDAGENSASFIILPANSPAHAEFALHAPRYPGFALHPLVGWVAGVDLDLIGKAAPKVFCGNPQPLGEDAVVMRLKLPPGQLAQVKIINLFRPGHGDIITFPTGGFSATTAIINGREANFADYLNGLNADTRLPLVADYYGVMVNVALKNIGPKNGSVEFFAPVVPGTEYRLANPIEDYVSAIDARLKDLSPDNVLFSCNCIHNYLFSRLEGRRTGSLVGPFTFGEIAFQLLNQTLVYIEIVNVASPQIPVDQTGSDTTTFQLCAAHEELQASERRFRTLSESMPLGIFLIDAIGRPIYTNPHCQQLTGVSTEDSADGGWMRRLHPSDLPGVLAALKENEREGGDFAIEFRLVEPDGKIRWVHSRASVLRSDNGAITGRIGTLQDITARKEAEARLEEMNLELIRASREAGIAELATGVLHNVKNVINSINVSATVIADQLQKSKSSGLTKLTALLREHSSDLGSFISHHPKGKLVPGYLEMLDQQLTAERTAILRELASFATNVQHIKDIVTLQQTFAKGGTTEKVKPVDLMEDSLRINAAALTRHGIQVIREYQPDLPDITLEKHKVLQILVNFIRNAKQACQSADRPDKKLILRLSNGDGSIHFDVTDNGIGISAENRARMFDHGFTTKKDGHGFGLHSAALAVRQLGGDIQFHSDGVGTGATFSLTLPLRQPAPPAPT